MYPNTCLIVLSMTSSILPCQEHILRHAPYIWLVATLECSSGIGSGLVMTTATSCCISTSPPCSTLPHVPCSVGIMITLRPHRHSQSRVRLRTSAFDLGVWKCLGASGMSGTDAPRHCQCLAPELYLWIQTAVSGHRKPLQHPDIYSSAIYTVLFRYLCFLHIS